MAHRLENALGEFPSQALKRFETLEVTPLVKDRALRKDCEALLKEAQSGSLYSDPMPGMDRVLESVVALMGAVSRNTSPYYHRQIQALARFALELREDEGPAKELSVQQWTRLVNTTAETVHKAWLGVQEA